MKALLAIYTPLGADGYELCHPTNPDDFERINSEVNGVSRRSKWDPIHMDILREDEGKQLIASDSPWLGSHALIFRRSAISKLESELLTYGELLSLACTSADISLYNPTRVLDALDESASSVLRFPHGRIMMVQQYAFKEDAVRNIHIFKISNLRVSPTFLSQAFVDLWNASGLTGLEFQKVWSSSE